MTNDPTTRHLTADELRTCAAAIDMWESEFRVSGDDWSEELVLRDKLLRMAAALDTEEHNPDDATTEEHP